jgi:RNA polymerase sigma-70 factor (ECF subfamily)
MHEEQTTVIIQRYLDAMPGDTAAEPIVRELLEQAVRRLRLLCGTFLHKSYSRLTRPPVNQHMRWQLNDLARRLDARPAAEALAETGVAAPPASTASGLSPDGLRMLAAIEGLPEDEREAFDLVGIQGLTQAEAAMIVGVSEKTVQRRVNRARLLLAERLADLRPHQEPGDRGQESNDPPAS